jgi:ATP-binding cassette subfamily B protein
VTPPDAATEAAIARVWWPLDRLAEALEAMPPRLGLRREPGAAPLTTPPGFARGETAELAGWLNWACERLGLEAAPVDAAIAELDDLLRSAGPAILLYGRGEVIGFLVLVGGVRDRIRLLGPDLTVCACPIRTLRTALCAARESPLVAETDRVLALAGVGPDRIAPVRAAMLAARLAAERIGGVWMLRLPPSAAFRTQLAEAGVLRRIGQGLAAFAVIYGLEIVGWSLIGSTALEGRLDFGWLAAWGLLLLTLVPLRLAGDWVEATFALDASRVLKSRLLAGALAMAPDTVKHGGVGRLISRVMESQALESLALNGGVALAVSVLELGFAGWILGQGAGGAGHVGLLLVWTGLTAWLALRYHHRFRAWSLHRLEMTHDLIESMVGHRTRLAQERASRRELAEDSALNAYVTRSKSLDGAGLQVMTALPSLWPLVALAGLAPALLGAAPPSPTHLAISLGGVILAQGAFGGIAGALASCSRAVVAWREVKPLFVAGGVPTSPRPFLPASTFGKVAAGAPLLTGQALTFAYEASADPVIDGADLTIRGGDRILLEGPSGAGKSTLSALITGLAQPRSGLLRLNGLDRSTLGDAWQRIATTAPQFHENHILSGSLAFNLLMGRRWPAAPDDLAEAEAICEELGLGELLRRMPGGLNQRVGETGWRLSHGERSRVFLARALLQGAALTVMDESFAALDPETLELCLNCVLRRAGALVVIAHP